MDKKCLFFEEFFFPFQGKQKWNDEQILGISVQVALRPMRNGNELFFTKSDWTPFPTPFQLKCDMNRDFPFQLLKLQNYGKVCENQQYSELIPFIFPDYHSWSVVTRGRKYYGQISSNYYGQNEDAILALFHAAQDGFAKNDGKYGFLSAFHYIPYEKEFALTPQNLVAMRKFL